MLSHNRDGGKQLFFFLLLRNITYISYFIYLFSLSLLGVPDYEEKFQSYTDM